MPPKWRLRNAATAAATTDPRATSAVSDRCRPAPTAAAAARLLSATVMAAASDLSAVCKAVSLEPSGAASAAARAERIATSTAGVMIGVSDIMVLLPNVGVDLAAWQELDRVCALRGFVAPLKPRPLSALTFPWPNFPGKTVDTAHDVGPVKDSWRTKGDSPADLFNLDHYPITAVCRECKRPIVASTFLAAWVHGG